MYEITSYDYLCLTKQCKHPYLLLTLYFLSTHNGCAKIIYEYQVRRLRGCNGCISTHQIISGWITPVLMKNYQENSLLAVRKRAFLYPNNKIHFFENFEPRYLSPRTWAREFILTQIISAQMVSILKSAHGKMHFNHYPLPFFFVVLR